MVTQKNLAEMIQSLITHEKLIPDHFYLIFHDFAVMFKT